MPDPDIGAIAVVTGTEVRRIAADNAAYSGGTTNAYVNVFNASGMGSGLHGSVSLLNKGPLSFDYFLGGNDCYGTLSSGNAVTVTNNTISSVNLDNVTLVSGRSPLTSIEIQVKSSVLNQSGLASIRPCVLH